MKMQNHGVAIETPTNILIRRFPDLRIEILNYYQQSKVFREICNDYALLISWLKKNPRDESESSLAHKHVSELLEEIGSEAHDFIKRQRPDLWR